INVHKGTPSGAPFPLTLEQAVGQLEELAKKAGRLDQVSWAQTLRRPAVNQRNAVAHAVTFTADDGLQAIGTMDHSPPGRFLDEELRGVILTLLHASMRLPKSRHRFAPCWGRATTCTGSMHPRPDATRTT